MPSFPEYSSVAPGVFAEQNFTQTPTVAEPELPACIIGPAKLLSRYGQEDPTQFLFTGAAQSLPWSAKIQDVDTELSISTHRVDHAAARLYMRGGEIRLNTVLRSDLTSFVLHSATEPNVIRLDNNGVVAGTGLLTGFRGRNVTVGDVVLCIGNDGDTVLRRTVTGLRGKVSAGTFGSNVAGDNSDAGNAASNPATSTASATQVSVPSGWTIGCANPGDFDGLARGAKFNGAYGERFIITVHTAGLPGTGKVNIRSSSGKFVADNVATVNSAGNFSITDTNAGGELGGVDLLLTPPAAPNNELVVGQSWTIDIVGAYSQLTTTQVAPAGSYTGESDTTYIVEVLTKPTGGTSFTGATVRVSDTAGIDVNGSVVTLTDGTPFNLGTLGLTLEFTGSGDMPDHAGLLVGDRYYVHAKAGAVSTTIFDKVVLNGPAVDLATFNPAHQLFSVEFRMPYTGEIDRDGASDTTAWSADEGALAVESTLQFNVVARDSGYQWCDFVGSVGYLVPSFTASIIPSTVEMVAINTSNVEEICGVDDNANPLGSAVRAALEGASGTTVYAINTGGELLSHYQAALNAIRNNRTPYELVLLSELRTVWAAAKAHVVEASGNERLLNRRVRLSIESPGAYPVLSTRSDTTNFTATITEYNGEYRMVTIVAGASEAGLTGLDIAADGTLLHDGTHYPIEQVISDTELLLSNGPVAAVDPAEAIQIWRSETKASQKAWLRDAAASMQDRRVTVVWCDRPRAVVNAQSTQVPVLLGAAYLAGRRSYLPPQVGMTHQTVPVFETAPRMHSFWDADDIKEIASYGIQVLHQEDPSAGVAVFDQVTTDTQHTYLEFQENSTLRLDLITRLLRQIVLSRRGVTNATDKLADDIRADVLSMLIERNRYNLDSPYGPLIDDYRAPTVEVNPQLVNQIDTRVLVAIGPPATRFWFSITGTPRLAA